MSTQLNDPELHRRDLCFIDIETTGSVFGYHEITEIAAIRTSPDGTKIIGEWSRKLSPRHPGRITAHAKTLTQFEYRGWSSIDVSSPEVWQAFAEFARGCVPICHNPSFERAFISLAAAEAGVQDLGLDYHWIGTESLAWPLFRSQMIRKLSLKSITEFLTLQIESDVHAAMNGARVCRYVYLALMATYRLSMPLDPETANSI